mgnify:CR=1 FL=1
MGIVQRTSTHYSAIFRALFDSKARTYVFEFINLWSFLWKMLGQMDCCWAENNRMIIQCKSFDVDEDITETLP